MSSAVRQEPARFAEARPLGLRLASRWRFRRCCLLGSPGAWRQRWPRCLAPRRSLCRLHPRWARLRPVSGCPKARCEPRWCQGRATGVATKGHTRPPTAAQEAQLPKPRPSCAAFPQRHRSQLAASAAPLKQIPEVGFKEQWRRIRPKPKDAIFVLLTIGTVCRLRLRRHDSS